MKPLEVVGFGLVSGLNRDSARTGIHVVGFSADTSRWGSYVSMRVDSIAGLDLLADEADQDDHDEGDIRHDDYQGAVVLNFGGLFRATHTFGIYAGLGYGNFYDRRVENIQGEDTVKLRTLYWQENLQTGVLWTPSPAFGIDFGYETFDESWHLAFVAEM